MPEPAVYVLEKMAHGFKRKGGEHGGGFYDPQDGEPASLWPGLKAFERRSGRIPDEEVRERLLYAQALETLRCLREGAIDGPREGNVASILGAAFPASTGGALRFVEQIGAAEFSRRASALAQKHGARFEAPGASMDSPRHGEAP